MVGDLPRHMPTAIEVFLQSALDYAGTFPPAGLNLADAVSTYARAQTGAYGWLVGRLVLPAAHLQEFEQLAPTIFGDPGQPPCRLSLIVTGNSLEQVERFNTEWRGRAFIAALEFGPLDAVEIDRMARRVPDTVEAFFEVPPLHADRDGRIEAIARHGASAKIRTGGILARSFPTETEVIHFMTACAAARIAFKATAGLHHAVRGHYPVTYEPDSPQACMHGFLNVSVAAALVRTGASSAAVLEALREPSAEAFAFCPSGLTWRDRNIATDDLADTRRHFFRSFGSCAFEAPVEELERLRLV
jgi:hypothetical protein